jgi:hypothetical protein
MIDSVRTNERSLLSVLGMRVSQLGFSAKATGQRFFRDIALGSQILHLSFIKNGGEFDVTVDVAIRVAVLEEMLDPQDAHRPPKEQMASFGAELGNIARGERIRWTVSSAEDVEIVAESIFAAIERIGVPYLERYSDLEQMLDALTPNDRSAWLHSPFHFWRCMRIVGLCILSGRYSDFERTRQACRQFLVNAKDPQVSSFDAFADRIRPHEQSTG